jgi:N-methylhydantoinase A/oxoprolinase/acetone carboxylase beta subunit
MGLVLGIDTGGTYTDTVALQADTGEVLAWNKAATTHHDLVVGISQSINGLPNLRPTDIELVALSTTLATNAAIEGIGGRVAAILIGYDKHLLVTRRLDRRIPASAIEYVSGRHDVFGYERAPMATDELRQAIDRWTDHVDAFAICSYLGVRNPEHELRAGEIAREHTNLPVVLGNDVGHSLDSVKRATTAVLNARLIPMVDRLLTAVNSSVSSLQITAPIVVLGGDAALMSLDLAKAHPIQTLLSGQAASVSGARHLTGLDMAVVADTGGTTTDITLLADGLPSVSTDGAVIGDWRTALRAVDTYSIGLGGNSRITTDPLDLNVGPERVESIAVSAASDPTIADTLNLLERDNATHRLVPVWEFLAAGTEGPVSMMSEHEQNIFDALQDRPLDVTTLAKRVGLPDPRLLNPRALIARGAIRRIGLTPTDILHVRGDFQAYDVHAATLACRIAARESRITANEFVSRTHEFIIRKMATGLLRSAVRAVNPKVSFIDDGLGKFLLDRSASTNHRSSILDVRLEVIPPVVALGGAAGAWMPQVASRLHTDCETPRLAPVASAVGAGRAEIAQQVEFLLRPLYTRAGVTGYVVHGPTQWEHFKSIEQARAHVDELGPKLAHNHALTAGVHHPQIRRTETSWDAENENPNEGSYLMETRFTFVGFGRPGVRDH